MWTDLNRPPLNATALRRSLVDGPDSYWSSLEVRTETGSTNADLLARAAADVTLDRSVLIAEFQVSGRGRHLRVWTSPPRAQISMSVLLRVDGLDPSTIGWLPLLTGVAVVEALRNVAEVDAHLKWPNDVLIGDRKVAGILAEMVYGHGHPAVVVGVGLNVTLTEDELPVPTATSLALEGAACVDRDTLVRALLRAYPPRIAQFRSSAARTSLARDYRALCSTLGRRVRASLPGDREVVGIARDIDPEGRLLIVPEVGGSRAEFAVAAGDITHLRPVD